MDNSPLISTDFHGKHSLIRANSCQFVAKSSFSDKLLGVRLFRSRGKQDPNRADSALLGFEKTTELVTTGLYHYIRHPFYSSLLFLDWGIFLKRVSWAGVLLAVVATIFLIMTTRKEEAENIRYFGGPYRAYMKRTKMFVPCVF